MLPTKSVVRMKDFMVILVQKVFSNGFVLWWWCQALEIVGTLRGNVERCELLFSMSHFFSDLEKNKLLTNNSRYTLRYTYGVVSEHGSPSNSWDPPPNWVVSVIAAVESATYAGATTRRWMIVHCEL